MTLKWDRKRFRVLDRKGGIEGLPMELMIIVIVATLGIAILVGWMGSIEEPHTIGDVELSQSVFDGKRTGGSEYNCGNLFITVTDDEGVPIDGAEVVLTGCNVHYKNYAGSVVQTTNFQGKVNFCDLVVALVPGTHYIDIHVHTDDYGDDDSAKILVLK